VGPPAEAQAVSRERASLAAKVEAVQVLENGLKDALEYAELADMEGDEALAGGRPRPAQGP
jgi:peptide chain release factor 2